jgi:hypothetical protein
VPPVYVDNSLLVAVARCDTESVTRHFHGYTSIEEAATLRSGSAAHEGIAAWFKGSSARIAQAYITSHYKEWADENVPSDDRLSYDNVAKIMRRWFAKNPVSRLPFVIHKELIEVGYAVPLDENGDIVFTGRIDAIVGDPDSDAFYPMDNKTTGRIAGRFKAKFRNDSQLSGYIWAVREHLEESGIIKSAKVPGAYINAIEFGRLPSSTRRCSRHAAPFTKCAALHANWEFIGPIGRTDWQIKQWKRNALALAKKYIALCDRYPELKDIVKLNQQGSFTGSCPYCAFHDFCVAGRSVRLIPSMLHYEPWAPHEGARNERRIAGGKRKG